MTKRDAILQAADRLFSKDGYGLTGVDALAAEAGVTKRTLYKQFGSKEALFNEWLRLRDARTRRGLLAAVEARADSPLGRLLALFDILATLPHNPSFHGCPFSRALLEFGGKEANASSRRIAEEHKAALSEWFSSELTSAGVANVAAMTEELAMLYEGTLQRMAATGYPEAALAAKRILATRLKDVEIEP